MPARVYVETSVISYLAARPSRDLITAARQQITHEWWRRRRPNFEVFVSELVLDEARAADPDAATRRAELLANVLLLEITSVSVGLARCLIEEVSLPQQAGADALHIATAACRGVDYLLTWNAAHSANAEFRPRVERTCRAHGYEPPVLCTPDELMGEQTT